MLLVPLSLCTLWQLRCFTHGLTFSDCPASRNEVDATLNNCRAPSSSKLRRRANSGSIPPPVYLRNQWLKIIRRMALTYLPCVKIAMSSLGGGGGAPSLHTICFNWYLNLYLVLDKKTAFRIHYTHFLTKLQHDTIVSRIRVIFVDTDSKSIKKRRKITIFLLK